MRRSGLLTPVLASAAAALVVLAPASSASAASAPPPPGRPAKAIPAPTPAELAGYEATPDHAATLAFLRGIARRFPALRLQSFGTSAQGRELPLAIVSGDRAFTPAAAAKTGKPVVLIVSGIHAGEIDGKDAMLEILRDMALSRSPAQEVLDRAILLVVPIYNVDGHERISRFNRPNQDGPRDGMGFRVTASGLDLNRDHLKVASPEARALVRLVNAWRPHLHIDNHVTDGVDFRWTLTLGVVETPQATPEVDAWLRERVPAARARVEGAGYGTGPYTDLVDGTDPSRGVQSWGGPARFSTGYFALRHRASILVEMHSYKPYRDRVTANRLFLEGMLQEVARAPRALVDAVRAGEERTVALGRPGAAPSKVALRFERSDERDTVRVPFYAFSTRTSTVTGKPMLFFDRSEVRELEVPWFHRGKVAEEIDRPRGYLVLPGWPQIEDRLRVHGLKVRRLTAPATLDVQTLRVSEPKFASSSYQGLVSVGAKAAVAVEQRTVPAGTLWIPADQPDFDLAVQLLEPGSTESLFAWGLLSSVTERKEYIDTRVLEGHVATMLRDPQTAEAWEKALSDPAFAQDSGARWLWWYRRTPFWDESVGLMPVFRVPAAPAFATEPWS